MNDLKQQYLATRRKFAQELRAHHERTHNRELRAAGVTSQAATLIEVWQNLNRLEEAVGPEFVEAVAQRKG